MMYCELHKTYQSGKRSFYLNAKASFKLNAVNVLFGVSGAGKTSLLRLLSGLDKVDEGNIKVNDVYWSNTTIKTYLPIAQRNIAYVFQENNLFPNMTVLKNLQFVKKNYDKKLLNELIEVFEIKHLLMTKPNDLSGGQKQRVALARAILQKPDFLFLDEPFTALDEILKYKLQDYLLVFQKKLSCTIIMVSHQLQEVLKMATHVCLLQNGKVAQQGDASILLSKNHQNTLKATVLAIDDDHVSVLIDTQQITVAKSKIITPNFKKGGIVEVKL